MAVTFTTTLLRENISGTQKIMYWQLVASGTYTSSAITMPSLGLDQIDFMDITVDGGGANTNGVAFVSANLALNRFRFWGTGSADQGTFHEIAASTTVTGFTFRALVSGVA